MAKNTKPVTWVGVAHLLEGAGVHLEKVGTMKF